MAGVSLVLSLLLVGAGAEPAGTRALRVPLQSNRDGVLFVTAEPGRLGLFLPRQDGAFELRLLPSFHAPVQAMALHEADADGALDLVVSLADGTVALWLGDGRGEFVPREADLHEGHHPPHGHGILAPALAPEEESALREVLARSDRGWATGAVVELAPIGSPTRPRLLLAAADGTSREVFSPQAIHTVFVGQGGTVFNPSTLTIQPGDTVHWVWSSIGHNVVSGSNCTANNLFCSPSNTNCGANPTSSTGATYDRVFPTAGTFPYFCRPHCFFGMTGTVTVAAAASNVAEAEGLQVARGPNPGETQFGFTPACGATAHAIYFGEGSLAGGPVWSEALCADASGSHIASIGDPVGLQYFVVVGQNASAEGSYGTSTAGTERPEAVGIGTCDRPRVISESCP